MINFNYETNFQLKDESKINSWLESCTNNESFKLGELNYIFCSDEYLHKLNVEFLNHDTLTDIISFDYTVGKILQGDVFISIDRVKDNAKEFNVEFHAELLRVMIHGVLHFCGYNDKSEDDSKIMRAKEDFYISKY